MSSCNDPCGDDLSIIIDTGSRGDVGPPGPPSAVVEWTFYPSAGDTIISGDDASAKPLAYQEDSVQVFLNGVMLSKKDDYTTAADGLAIVLNESIVNAGDIVNILSQMPPSDFDPTNDHNRLQGQIDENKSSIEGLDVRVTANEEAIEGLTGLAGGVTTRTVKVSGVNTSRAVDGDLETQQDINILFDGLIADTEGRLDVIESGQPDLSLDIADLRTDVDENTQGISDNAQALNDIVDVVEANATDIDGLQGQIDKLPPPTDISDLEKDVDGIAKSVASNTVAISKNTADIAALPEMTIDLDPLNDAISLNSMGISSNAADITKLQTTDAKHTGQISDLEASVGHLESIDIPDNYAVVDEDNSFEKSQTIKGGINITGSEAFVKADTGTAVTFSNNNAFNPVIEIQRSNGDVSLALHADGHIRGVKTDENDDTSAVSVGYFEANVGSGGGDTDLSKYATKLALKDEETARIIGDESLSADIENAIKTQKYDDTEVRNLIGQETKDRSAADSSLSKKIDTEAQYREDSDDALQAQLDAIDPSLYATVVAMHAGDEETLAAANKYTTESIAAIEFPDDVDLDGYATEEFVTDAIDAIEFPAGTVVSATAPVDPEEGATWYDTVRLELFVFAEGAWLPCSPLGARVDAGEVLQAQILSRVEVGEAKQSSLESGTLKTSGNNSIETSWRLKSDGNTVMSGAEAGKIKIYNLAEPTDGHHACTKNHADTKLSRSGNDNDVLGDWRVRQQNAEGNYSTLIQGDNGQLGLYNLKEPSDSHHAVPRSYVDQKVSEIQLPQAGGPTNQYDGNRFNVSGVESKLLVENDVMFLQGAATVTNIGTIDGIALPEDEFDWEGCAKSGVVKVMNGEKLAGYFSVYDMVKNEGRNVILKVELLKLGDDYNVSYETGTPLYFHGVFFK